MEMNVKQITAYIKELVEIPSPAGFTEEAIDYAANLMDQWGVPYQITNKGALLATVPGKNTEKHRLLTAHVDTLGGMVKEIKADGRLKLTMVGGFRWNAAEGEYCTIHTASGRKITGTILSTKTSVHVYKDAGDIKREDATMEVRVDEVVRSRKETEAIGISVGDFVSFDPRVELTESGFIKSRHLDDKASVGILLYLISQIQEKKFEPAYTTHFLISNNEEIGYGGNSNIPPETVEYLAVDMGAIGEGQATDEYSVSICAKDSSGPYHYKLRRHLTELAEKNGVDYSVDIYPYYGSDASAAVRAGYDIAHGLVGAGIDASHAMERTHESSIQNTAALLYYYLQSELV